MTQPKPMRFVFRVRLNNLALVPLLFVGSLVLAGCPKNEPPPPSVRVSTSNRTEAASPVVPGAVAFNGERAMEHVKKQVDIGPRIPGSPELARTRAYIVDQLKTYGLKVTEDQF